MSMTCASADRQAGVCLPGCWMGAPNWCTEEKRWECCFPPQALGEMPRTQGQNERTGYNEVIVDTAAYVQQLPLSLEAFFTSHMLNTDEGPPPDAFVDNRERLRSLLSAAVAAHARRARAGAAPARARARRRRRRRRRRGRGRGRHRSASRTARTARARARARGRGRARCRAAVSRGRKCAHCGRFEPMYRGVKI